MKLSRRLQKGIQECLCKSWIKFLQNVVYKERIHNIFVFKQLKTCSRVQDRCFVWSIPWWSSEQLNFSWKYANKYKDWTDICCFVKVRTFMSCCWMWQSDNTVTDNDKTTSSDTWVKCRTLRVGITHNNIANIIYSLVITDVAASMFYSTFNTRSIHLLLFIYRVSH